MKSIKLSATEASPQPTEAEREEFAFSFILEALTQGLYPNVLDVLREYVQNSYDAVLKHMQRFHTGDYKIRVNVDGRSVFIADNGIGMSEEQIKQYRYVGYSEKKLGEEAGFRGIGKLSGISVAERLLVTSKAQGSPRCYTLAIDSRAMLQEILSLKREGKNKPLNELIHDNHEIMTEDAAVDEHYTVVELQNVRPEHSVLLNSARVGDYVSRICPVPLDPDFRYRQQVDDWLLSNVPDYVYIPHLVNDKPVYKPYTNYVEPPEFFGIEAEEGGEPIALSWACANLKEEQLPETGPRGLTFRLKNISIGDHEVARTMLWKTSGHLAYWYLGEVHIVDSAVVPSSERSGFEDNAARQRLVNRCRLDLIGRLINSARTRSGRANAIKKWDELERLVQNTELALAARTIPRETVVYEAAKVLNALEKAKKARAKLPSERKTQAKVIEEKSGDLVKRLQEEGPPVEATEGAFDIKAHLQLSEREWSLYDLIVELLRDLFASEPDRYIQAVKYLHERMLRAYG